MIIGQTIRAPREILWICKWLGRGEWKERGGVRALRGSRRRMLCWKALRERELGALIVTSSRSGRLSRTMELVEKIVLS
jgi:hypothetical protein